MLKNNYEYVMKQVDYAIKMAWLEDVSNDYRESYLIKEDSLKNALYFHVRKRLDNLFQMYNSNNWANGCVTELDACRYAEYKEESTAFSVYSYNTFNPQLNTERIEQMKFVKLS